jgi:hypothetical protein
LCWFSNGDEPFYISGGNEIRCEPEAVLTITQARESVKSIFARFQKMARSLLPTACDGNRKEICITYAIPEESEEDAIVSSGGS